MRNRETWFENLGGGFIHSSAHLSDGDRERETVHKAHRGRDGGRENEVPLARYHQIVGTTIGKVFFFFFFLSFLDLGMILVGLNLFRYLDYTRF